MSSEQILNFPHAQFDSDSDEGPEPEESEEAVAQVAIPTQEEVLLSLD